MKKEVLLNIAMLAVAVIALTTFLSCSDDKTQDVEFVEQEVVSVENADSGIIPQEVGHTYFLDQVQNKPSEHVELLQRFESEYSDKEFYNNLYEVSVTSLLTTDALKQLSDEEVNYVFDAMVNQESNLLNISGFANLSIQRLHRGLIPFEELVVIAEDFKQKNSAMVSSIDWHNLKTKQEKIDELNNAFTRMTYPRLKYSSI